MCPNLTLLDQDAVIWCSRLVSYLDDPSDDIQDPNILDDILGESLSISSHPSCDGSVSVASLSDIHYFPSGSHLNSIRYHSFISALTFPPVALADPANILKPFCASFAVYSRGVSGECATFMIVE